MNVKLMAIAFLIPSIICVSTAGFLCWAGKDGWGWFLVVAVFLYGTPTFIARTSESEEDNNV